MRSSPKSLLAILIGLGVGWGAQAVKPAPSLDQFQGIPERNVFGLKSPQAEPDTEPAKGPPPQLTLTGITTLLGNKLALMRAALPGAAGKPAQEKSLMLTEGQREGNIEVLEINEKLGTVRVNDAGDVTTISFAKNGVKSPNAPVTTGAAVVPGTNYLNVPGLNSRMRVLPTRIPRVPVGNPAPETGSAGAAGRAGAAAATQTAPTAADTALSPTGRVPTTNAAPAESQLSPEAQVLLQELEREKAQQDAAAANANQSQPQPYIPPGTPLPRLAPGANTQRSNPPLFPPSPLMPQ